MEDQHAFPPPSSLLRRLSSGSLALWRDRRGRVSGLRIVTLVYAAVFAVEGGGLWMEKRWAEWLTVATTASLMFPESWELFHRPTVGKLLILLGNAAIVAYLVWDVRTHSKFAALTPAPEQKPS